jgi:hypothetical protein
VKLIIQFFDLAPLASQAIGRQPIRYLQALRMIRNCDVRVSALLGGLEHFHYRACSIAPIGMHLEIAADSAQPCRASGQFCACLSKREEIASYFRRRRGGGRIGEPLAKPFRNIWSYRRQFCQRVSSFEEFTGFLSPHIGATCGAPKSFDGGRASLFGLAR